MVLKLKDIDSTKLKSGLTSNAKALLEAISNEERPLYDVVSLINTAIDSLKIYKNELIDIKNEAKDSQIDGINDN